MSTAVKLSESIVTQAKVSSKAMSRSVAKQIEYWAKIGKVAEENPDFFLFVKRRIKEEFND